jgi:hypothetical protein
METVFHIYREIHGSLIPINLDGLLGGVEHDSATVAVLEVSFQLPTQVLVEFAIDRGSVLATSSCTPWSSFFEGQ